MKTFFRVTNYVFWILLPIGIPNRSAHAAEDSLVLIPLGSPERSLWYDWTEREALRHHSLSVGSHSRAPFFFRQATFDSSSAFNWFRSQRSDLAGQISFGSTQHLEQHNSPGSFESFSGEFALAPVPSITVHLAGSLDEARAKDPDYRGKKWRGLAGDLSSAFVGYHHGSMNAWFGRFTSSWGDRQSLLLSPEVSLDGLEYSLPWKRLTLRYRLARLDGLNPDTDSVTEFSNRYLAGHRLEYDMNDDIQVAIGEMVVFGGPGRAVDFGYLNPLLFFHGSQLNEDVNDNTLIFADLTIRAFSRTKVFGQLVIDDFQIDREARGDNEPTQYALRGILDHSDIFTKTDIQLSYTRVSNWTYNQIDPRNRYSYLGKPIAAVRGNDYDEAKLSMSHWFTPVTRASASILCRRQGEGRIVAQWSEPWILATGSYSEPFPTGVVESLLQPSISFDGYLTAWLFLNADAGIHIFKNELNMSSSKSTRPFFSLRLTVPIGFTIPIS